LFGGVRQEVALANSEAQEVIDRNRGRLKERLQGDGEYFAAKGDVVAARSLGPKATTREEREMLNRVIARGEGDMKNTERGRVLAEMEAASEKQQKAQRIEGLVSQLETKPS
jgi:hypothetical protein